MLQCIIFVPLVPDSSSSTAQLGGGVEVVTLLSPLRTTVATSGTTRVICSGLVFNCLTVINVCTLERYSSRWKVSRGIQVFYKVFPSFAFFSRRFITEL